MFIDTHCHLDAPEFAEDQTEVIARAHAAGVTQIVIPAVAERTFAATLALRSHPGCMAALGLHPIYISEHTEAHLELLRQQLRQERPVAIGEIGLDFFIKTLDPALQIHFFVAQLQLARQFELPVILHVRSSCDQVLKYLRQYRPCSGIAHAFNGSAQQAGEFIKLGFKLGFGGAMTWARARHIRRLAQEIPLENLVLETDAPDIPAEWRSQQGRSEPADLARYAQILAELRDCRVADIAQVTSAATRQALRLP